ncbi:hypothetical protein Tco_1092673 [Tanacetum coccineum]|uniref:Uncharacterized protein n=1 Tax=Tanacetum coccineum TaxID=301880 RepID=A0ABQ5IBU1_9ASTR
MDESATRKVIKRELSNARTPYQMVLQKERNRTLIEACKDLLADAKLPVTFWAEAEYGNKRRSSKGARCTADVTESSGNTIPRASSKDSLADQVEPSPELPASPTVETAVPTVSTPIPTGSKSIPPITSSLPKIISRGGSSYSEPLSLGNMMEIYWIQLIPPSLTIIGPIDTPVQTRHKAKNVEEQSFIATIHQKNNPDLLQYCLFLCFLSQEEPKKIVDALKDESWDVIRAFSVGTIDEEVYVIATPALKIPEFLDKVLLVEKLMYETPSST